MRSVTKFICQQCSYQSPSFLGKCPNCGAWNSLIETVEEIRNPKSEIRNKKTRGIAAKPIRVAEIKVEQLKRVSTGMEELDRVLGGGLLPGAVMLLSGDPGIGKSTLLLHVALYRAGQGDKVLYITGEESAAQIKLRIDRLLNKSKDIKLNSFYLLSETHVESLLSAIEDMSPDLIIVDSIQTMETETLSGMAGSVGQVRESANLLLQAAKKNHIATFFVGHVTKEGTIAGPQVLSHMVDAVLFFEGERFQSIRILRGIKNRFGPVDEVGLFEMNGSGFTQVSDPNNFFLSGKDKLPGKAVVLTLEGTRPLLCEIQALVVPTKLPFPKRVVSGLDTKRVELMVAVLQKTLRLPLERFDIFISTTAGLKSLEPALDLGICLAIVSSFKNKPLAGKSLAIGEVSLLGEINNVSQIDRRVKEAKRLGFTKIISADEFEGIENVVRKVFV